MDTERCRVSQHDQTVQVRDNRRIAQSQINGHPTDQVLQRHCFRERIYHLADRYARCQQTKRSGCTIGYHGPHDRYGWMERFHASVLFRSQPGKQSERAKLQALETLFLPQGKIESTHPVTG